MCRRCPALVAICCICTLVVLELLTNKSEFVYTTVWDNELIEFDYESGCLCGISDKAKIFPKWPRITMFRPKSIY